jgi:uncharacterized protein (TIGR03437 family)
MQINVRVPASIAPGSAVPVVITIGDVALPLPAGSQAGVTLAVR